MDEKFRGHPLNVSENLGYRKSLCIIGGITIFRRKFFVSQCGKISWASFQCFRKFGVSKNFMHNRGITIFRRKFFVSQCRKIFVGGGSFSVSLILGTEKIWIRGGRGSIKIFRRSLYLTVPKHFIGKHFGVVSEKFFHRNFSCIGGAGGITVLSELFVSQHRNEKLCKGTLLFSGNFLVSKKNYG